MPSVGDALKEIALHSAEIAAEYFRNSRLKSWTKDGGSIVTEADQKVQEYVVEELRRYFPDAGIIGEESYSFAPDDFEQHPDKDWFAVDPIDGTTSFAHGLPGWCISIGMIRNGKAHAGVVYSPPWKEMYLADGDSGEATFNDEVLPQLEDPGTIDRSTAIVCDSKLLQMLTSDYPGKIRSYGSTALHFCLAARGVIDFAQSNRVHVWDIAAAAAIGGAVGMDFTYLSGKPVEFTTLLNAERVPEPIFAGHKARVCDLCSLFALRK